MIMNVNLAALFEANQALILAVKSKTLSSMHSMGSATKNAPPRAATVINTVKIATIEVRYKRYFFKSYKIRG